MWSILYRPIYYIECNLGEQFVITFLCCYKDKHYLYIFYVGKHNLASCYVSHKLTYVHVFGFMHI